jgi:hypothetical protein
LSVAIDRSFVTFGYCCRYRFPLLIGLVTDERPDDASVDHPLPPALGAERRPVAPRSGARGTVNPGEPP